MVSSGGAERSLMAEGRFEHERCDPLWTGDGVFVLHIVERLHQQWSERSGAGVLEGGLSSRKHAHHLALRQEHMHSGWVLPRELVCTIAGHVARDAVLLDSVVRGGPA